MEEKIENNQVITPYLYCEQTGNTIDKHGFHQGFTSSIDKKTTLMLLKWYNTKFSYFSIFYYKNMKLKKTKTLIGRNMCIN